MPLVVRQIDGAFGLVCTASETGLDNYRRRIQGRVFLNHRARRGRTVSLDEQPLCA